MTENDLHPNANPDYLISLLFRTTATLVLALILLGIDAMHPSYISPKPAEPLHPEASAAAGRSLAPNPADHVDRHVDDVRALASGRNQRQTGFAVPMPWNPIAEVSSSSTSAANFAAAGVPTATPPGRCDQRPEGTARTGETPSLDPNATGSTGPVPSATEIRVGVRSDPTSAT